MIPDDNLYHREHVTLPVAAKHIGVAPETLWRYVERGFLEGFKTPGNHRRVFLDSLHAAVNSPTVMELMRRRGSEALIPTQIRIDPRVVRPEARERLQKRTAVRLGVWDGPVEETKGRTGPPRPSRNPFQEPGQGTPGVTGSPVTGGPVRTGNGPQETANGPEMDRSPLRILEGLYQQLHDVETGKLVMDEKMYDALAVRVARIAERLAELDKRG